MHVVVDNNGLPLSALLSSANNHDSIKFIDVMESISEYLDDDTINPIISVCADKEYDAKYIRAHLANRNITCYIPYKTNSKFILQNNTQNNYNKTRFIVERFFAWLKNGFHRTRIRYERIVENYLAFVTISSIMVYWRILG
jgi:transposase